MGGLDAHGVHHGIHGHSHLQFLLFQRNAEFVEGVEKLGVDLFERFGPFFLHRRCVIAYCLEVDFGYVKMGPVGRGEREPVAVGLQAEFEQPVGLSFAGGDKPYHVLVETLGDDLRVDVGGKTIFIVARNRAVNVAAARYACAGGIRLAGLRRRRWEFRFFVHKTIG